MTAARDARCSHCRTPLDGGHRWFDRLPFDTDAAAAGHAGALCPSCLDELGPVVTVPTELLSALVELAGRLVDELEERRRYLDAGSEEHAAVVQAAEDAAAAALAAERLLD